MWKEEVIQRENKTIRWASKSKCQSFFKLLNAQTPKYVTKTIDLFKCGILENNLLFSSVVIFGDLWSPVIMLLFSAV